MQYDVLQLSRTNFGTERDVLACALSQAWCRLMQNSSLPGCILGRIDDLWPVQQLNDFPCCQAQQRLLQVMWLQRVLAGWPREQVCEGQQSLLALQRVL